MVCVKYFSKLIDLLMEEYKFFPVKYRNDTMMLAVLTFYWVKCITNIQLSSDYFGLAKCSQYFTLDSCLN